MEPWDGPAALAMTDGRWAVAGMDRNALRPLRYTLHLRMACSIVGSESGMVLSCLNRPSSARRAGSGRAR